MYLKGATNDLYQKIARNVKIEIIFLAYIALDQLQ